MDFIQRANRLCLEPLRSEDWLIPSQELIHITSAEWAIPMAKLANKYANDDKGLKEVLRTVECWLLANDVSTNLKLIFDNSSLLYPLIPRCTMYLSINTEIVANWLFKAVIGPEVKKFKDNRDLRNEVYKEILEETKKNYFFIGRVKWVDNNIENVLREVARNLMYNFLKREQTLWFNRRRTFTELSSLDDEGKAQDLLDRTLGDLHVAMDLDETLLLHDLGSLKIKDRQKKIIENTLTAPIVKINKGRKPDITQIQLAKKLGVSPKTIQRDILEMEWLKNYLTDSSTPVSESLTSWPDLSHSIRHEKHEKELRCPFCDKIITEPNIQPITCPYCNTVFDPKTI